MYIKLSKPAGPTRRLVFQAVPDWLSLSAKVSELYHIPQSQVALGYTDVSDEDIVTINSNEELAQCLSIISTDDIARFVVQDLGEMQFNPISRDAVVLGSDIHAWKPSEDDVQDWVDVSDPLIQQNREMNTNAAAENQIFNVQDQPSGDAVQPNAYEDYITHLMSHGIAQEVGTDDILPSDNMETLISSNLRRIEDRPLPMATASDANTEYDDDETSIQSEPEEHVLPRQRSSRPSSSDPSIISDLTMLVSTLSSASSCHPEITVGLFNLLSNTKSGTYWSPLKRDVRRFASKAASEGIIAAQAICTEGIRAAAEVRTNGIEADERMRSAREAMKLEAELRISEAMGAVMREFSGFNRPPLP